MGVQLARVRVNNFRSLESLDIDTTSSNVLIGQNNCGKSNFLKAINIALNSVPSVSESDIYITNGEKLSKDKISIIDVMLRPTKQDQTYDKEFSEFWVSVFGDKWIATDEIAGSFVGIRTIIEYDAKFDRYNIVKKAIKQWGDSIENAMCSKKQSFTNDMQSYMACFYMDAHRDIIDDLKSKKSYFGRATSNRGISDDVIVEIEKQLGEINTQLVINTPALIDTQKTISKIGSILGNQNTQLTIEPISPTLNDLNRGMDIKYLEGHGPNLSVTKQGMGTRSWISFLTLSAYITYLTKSIKSEDEDAELFVVLALEEPEAHLHSYAQKKLFDQISSFPGQKIVTTHSASIIAQASVLDFVHLYKIDGKTFARRIEKDQYSNDELQKIQREFIHSKGDLLFSTAIVLAEGITEELALPVYYNKFFGTDPNASGVAILGIGGQNYNAFLHLVKDFNIPWFIFSDGEPQTINTLKNVLKTVFNKELDKFSNVIVIEDGDDYEDHLVNSGYSEYMKKAINNYELEVYTAADPEGAKADTRNYLEKFIEKNNHTVAGHADTGKKCKECGHPIKEDIIRVYDGPEGEKNALLDCCQRGKAKYAYIIADEIVSSAPEEQKIPPKVKELFVQLGEVLKEGEKVEN